MNEVPTLLDQIVSDIFAQASHLDDLRLRLFVNWLIAHSRKVKESAGLNGQAGHMMQMNISIRGEEKVAERLAAGLRAWFESLPVPCLLREYHLMLNEISWWRGLDSRRLVMILRSEAGQ